MRRMLLLGGSVLFLTLAINVAATELDRCKWATSAQAMSADEQFQVELTYDDQQNSWTFVSRNEQKQIGKGTIEQMRAHSHPLVFVAPAGDRFVVFEPTATTRNSNRLLVFDFQGKLLKSYGVTDLLNAAEQKKITKSRSHLGWTMPHEKHGRGWLTEDGKSFSFIAVGGQVHKVSLYETESREQPLHEQ